MKWLFAFILLMAKPYTPSQQTVSPDLFVEAYVSLAEPYAGQQVEYQVRFFDSVGATNPLYEAPSFEGFWRVEPDRISRTVEVRDNRQYSVTDIRTTLYPNVPGDIVIEPARVVVPETVFAAEQRFETPSLLVRARALPEGAPVGFSGAVGEVTLQAALDRQQVRIGEPITLRLLFTGNANVLVLPPPDLAALQSWRAYVQSRTATFETSVPGLIGQQEISIVLLPSQAGNYVLPVLSFSYFDPVAAIYRQLGTGEIPLEVLPSLGTVSDSDPVVLTGLPLREVDLSVGVASSNLSQYWIMWLIGPLILLLAGLWRWRSAITERWFGNKMRSSNHLSQSRLAIRAALRSPNSASDLQTTLHTYLASQYPLAQSDTLTDLTDFLSQGNLDTLMTRRLLSIVESLGYVQYAPFGSADKAEIRQLAQQLDAFLVDLDAALK
ncbi:MAG TPA: BatD family protein [Aggregatilineales bacterium]|nr:BatD family protein [Aggregatilineales bacterium]